MSGPDVCNHMTPIDQHCQECADEAPGCPFTIDIFEDGRDAVAVATYCGQEFVLSKQLMGFKFCPYCGRRLG